MYFNIIFIMLLDENNGHAKLIVKNIKIIYFYSIHL